VAKLTTQIFSSEIRRQKSRMATHSEIDSCYAAALLHDCVPVAKDSPLRKESSRLASEQAQEWLIELEWDAEQASLIVAAILDHSYSAGRTPSSLLGESLQDADRLEALGALGIYRTIATGVAMKAEFFDPTDPWAKHREFDDKRFSIDHFHTKLLKLPASFKTHFAREEANGRAHFLRQFLFQLKHELES
jgi:uncharacterized protein